MDWIKVEDRLPEDRQDIIGYDAAGDTFYLCYFYKEKECFFLTLKHLQDEHHTHKETHRYSLGFTNITHWAELTKPEE